MVPYIQLLWQWQKYAVFKKVKNRIFFSRVFVLKQSIWKCHWYLLAQPQPHSWKQMESLNLNAIILTTAICGEISNDHILGFSEGTWECKLLWNVQINLATKNSTNPFLRWANWENHSHLVILTNECCVVAKFTISTVKTDRTCLWNVEVYVILNHYLHI